MEEEALAYHRDGRPGKVKTVATKPTSNGRGGHRNVPTNTVVPTRSTLVTADHLGRSS